MDLQKIGTFLKELRNGEGLTQEQLAEKLRAVLSRGKITFMQSNRRGR